MSNPPAPQAPEDANASFATLSHSLKTSAPDAARAQREAALVPEPKKSDHAEAPTWWVQVRDNAYGPYTAAHVRQFIVEGRVKPATLVANDRAGPWREARATEPFIGALRPHFNVAMPAEPGLANMFVFAEIHSGAWTAFMAALEAFGRIVELAPGFWLVRTHLTSGVVRNTLSQTLGRGDRFAVVDATRDRLAWFNLGPGTDVAIREVWSTGAAEAKR